MDPLEPSKAAPKESAEGKCKEGPQAPGALTPPLRPHRPGTRAHYTQNNGQEVQNGRHHRYHIETGR